MKKIGLVTILILFTQLISAQCFEKNTTFKTGEELSYEAYYNWGFIWLNAGHVVFSVKSDTYNSREAYFFDSWGRSHDNYDWIFKVRDYYRSWIDAETFEPLFFDRENYEGGFEVRNKYKFNHTDNIIYSETENSDKPFSRDTLKFPDCTYDLLSLMYYTRNIDFSNAKIGDIFPLHTIIDNEFFDLYIRYIGKETIKDKNDVSYRCVKFSALLVEGTIFEGGEDMYVWVTDDENKIPVLVEAKILVGSVKAYLSGTKNLRHPLNARLD